jgi:glyoxylase-like metal-dependent hydrolase (beta-lactamase superfamily II)
MTEVKILVEGYESVDSKEEIACSTISLIRDKNVIMVVDPGTVKDHRILVNALRREGLTIDDVNFVGITHSHMDHYRNIGLFPKAKAVDYWGIWDKDKNEEWDGSDIQFSDSIRIVKLPGHTYDSIVFLVKTKQGTVAICGDVFWKENHPKDDPYATDNKKLEESRKKLLQMADWIIPGHGKMFKVSK